MPSSPGGVVTTRLPTGALCHTLPLSLPELPPVPPAAIEAAWEVAREFAEAGLWGPPRLLRFAGGQEIALADADACAWAEALDRRHPLDTVTRLSLCLRLLALVEAMGRMRWLAGFFAIGRDGAEFHPLLLAAAASTPLDATGRFDETGIRRILGRTLPNPA